MNTNTRRGIQSRRGVGWAWAACALLAAFAVAPAASARESAARKAEARSGDDFEWTAQLKEGQTLEIKGINGAIWAEPAKTGRAVIQAKKHARRSDPASVRIEVNEHAGGVTICAIYPARRGRVNECEAGDGGHSESHNNDVQVDFSVQVPPGVEFVARTVNGSIEASDLDGPVDAQTVNGSVDVSTRGLARAHTVNGAVNARIGSSRWSDEVEFSTVNGGITVRFPEALSADLSASTVNGDISTDFPLTLRGKIGRRSLKGKIGDGAGGALSLSTVNGSIRLLAGHSRP